jgi:serine/threonine-protein kinase
MDFGVSKFATASSGGVRATHAGMVYGSPAYMSPEQLTGETAVDGRTDVFALGVVLFECLTGAIPFDGPTIEVLMVKILQGDMPPVESLRPGLPPALVDVVRHALAPNRDERIPSARALAEALTPFRALPSRPPPELGFAATVASEPPRMTSRPPSGPPPTLPPGMPRAGRRLVALLAITATAVAVGTVLILARPKPPAIAAATAQPSTATQSAAASATLAPTILATAATATERIPLPPPPERSERPADPRRSTLPPASSVAPSSSAPSPSTAQDLGLHTDNPFR